MERKIEFSIDEFYHVYNRGVEKRNIFLDARDRDRFLRLLYLANSDVPVVYRLTQKKPLAEIKVGKKLVAVGVYVLMPNHIHLLIREIIADGLSMFMEKLMTAYAMYFNKKYDRVGSLFQDRFKAEHADQDEHLKYLYAYIHLNPVKLIEPAWKENGVNNKRRAKEFITNYRYSSYQDYIGLDRQEKLILTKGKFPSYFDSKKSFTDLHKDWLHYNSG
jgi:putative transposase